eukprot:COSAG01_NODE_1651_length_9623_cov_6.232045_6_plen_159_part_00
MWRALRSRCRPPPTAGVPLVLPALGAAPRPRQQVDEGRVACLIALRRRIRNLQRIAPAHAHSTPQHHSAPTRTAVSAGRGVSCHQPADSCPLAPSLLLPAPRSAAGSAACSSDGARAGAAPRHVVIYLSGGLGLGLWLLITALTAPSSVHFSGGLGAV